MNRIFWYFRCWALAILFHVLLNSSFGGVSMACFWIQLGYIWIRIWYLDICGSHDMISSWFHMIWYGNIWDVVSIWASRKRGAGLFEGKWYWLLQAFCLRWKRLSRMKFLLQTSNNTMYLLMNHDECHIAFFSLEKHMPLAMLSLKLPWDERIALLILQTSNWPARPSHVRNRLGRYVNWL